MLFLGIAVYCICTAYGVHMGLTSCFFVYSDDDEEEEEELVFGSGDPSLGSQYLISLVRLDDMYIDLI